MTYRSVYKRSSCRMEENRSIFITHCSPVESESDAQKFIEEIREYYKDATHHCTAYVLGEQKLIQRYNDDGEPQGTAGIPILEVLKKEDVTNVVVVVTRYFGGIKLGGGGLIRAYSKACKNGLDHSMIIEKKPYLTVDCIFQYPALGSIENYLQINQLCVLEKKYEETICFRLLIDQDEAKKIQDRLVEITSGGLEWREYDISYESTNNGQLMERENGL